VSVALFPNTFDPELYVIDEDTVCTTKVCAVIVPEKREFEPVISPVATILPDTFKEPVICDYPVTVNEPEITESFNAMTPLRATNSKAIWFVSQFPFP